jgi:glycosyltransferase involved in cell wall biosynthesis
MILGIDASTVGSGGAKRHLIEVLNHFVPEKYNFSIIKIWGRQDVLEQLPNNPYLLKYSHPFLNRGLAYRTIWQFFIRDRSFKSEIDVLISPFGTYIGKFRPYATMSRNMLVFDKKEQKSFGFSLYRLKFILLFFIQTKSFRESQGLIFISKYAQEYIARHVDYSKTKTKIIHHGISELFIKKPTMQKLLSEYSLTNPYKFLYVSNVCEYKHQVNVVEVISRLRHNGFPVSLTLVGAIGQEETGKKLSKMIKYVDPHELYITWNQNVGLTKVVDFYHTSDAFIFASSCENMPNILMEAMASGLPIVCSSSKPMPEFLKNAGLYFNPANKDELEQVLIKFISNPDLRANLAIKSFEYSTKYSWKICADDTFRFLSSLS